MEDTPQKTCRYCGKSLPEEAIFCYYCRRELVTRPERPTTEPKPIKLQTWVAVGLVVILSVVVAYLLLS
ncbi:MAG: hypothetical protein BGO78_12710 [Chloroflexi bacterium 44-23]|nr:MAG: hypothetical protein BGO78_12710 [Chloroflexi bacterium 44-23]